MGRPTQRAARGWLTFGVATTLLASSLESDHDGSEVQPVAAEGPARACETIDVEGRHLRVDMVVWRDLQPGGKSPGESEGALQATVRILDSEGEAIPKGVALESVAFENEGENFEADVVGDLTSARVGQELSVRVPAWPGARELDASVRVRTPQGLREVRLEGVGVRQVE